MFETLDVFLFTFGLTECWRHKSDGAVLQLAPGVAGGEWNPDEYEFWNSRVADVAGDFLQFVDKLREINPKARVTVSVSPVPIIATMVPRHVLVSNSASKSILRVAADEVSSARPDIAYFPSYDLVSFGPNAARYYSDSMRELTPIGVSAVMRVFFEHFADSAPQTTPIKALKLDIAREAADVAKIVCDEESHRGGVRCGGTMAEALDPLIFDFVEWLAREPRTYVEAMDAWRTSCPRLTVWEDAMDRGLITRGWHEGAGARIEVTAQGHDFLSEHGRVATRGAIVIRTHGKRLT